MRSPSPSGMSSVGRAHSPSADLATSVTSKHKSLGQVEWNRQTSRAVAPYFIPTPTPDLRGCSGADRPRAHIPTVDIDRQPQRYSPSPQDGRDYTPVLYEDIHKHCGVDFKRAPTRTAMFGVKAHDAETVVDAFSYPGWGKGKKSFLPKAARDTFMGLRRWDTAQDNVPLPATKAVFSAYKPLPLERPVDAAVTPALKGGTIPKATDVLTADQKHLLERPALNVNIQAVSAHTPVVNLAAGASRAPKEKESSKYLRKFKTPPPLPLSTHEPRRISKGFAPMRQNFRNGVDDLLKMAAADVRRAQRLMEDNAGERSRSPARSAMYSHANTPTPTMGGGGMFSTTPGVDSNTSGR